MDSEKNCAPQHRDGKELQCDGVTHEHLQVKIQKSKLREHDHLLPLA